MLSERQRVEYLQFLATLEPVERYFRIQYMDYTSVAREYDRLYPKLRTIRRNVDETLTNKLEIERIEDEQMYDYVKGNPELYTRVKRDWRASEWFDPTDTTESKNAQTVTKPILELIPTVERIGKIDHTLDLLSSEFNSLMKRISEITATTDELSDERSQLVKLARECVNQL